MPNYDPFDHGILNLATLGALTSAWLHDLRSPLTGLNAILRNVLLSLDEIELSQETRRRLENQIGRAVDLSELAMRLTELFFLQISFLGELPRKIAITELVQDTLRVLEPVARRKFCIFEVESTGIQQPIRTHKVQLKHIIFNILLFAVRHITSPSDRPAKVVLSVQDADTILVTSDDPAFAETALPVFGYESRKDLLDQGEIELLIALELAQGLGGNIFPTKYGTKAAVAIKITAGEE